MGLWSLIWILVAASVQSVLQEDGPTKFDSVWVRVQRGISTECKSCPSPLCANKDFYGSSVQFMATCWTGGAAINNDRTWLKSDQGCYVTEIDTIPYRRNYSQDIRYCGPVKENFIPQDYFLQQDAACRICPHEKCEVLMYLRPRSMLTVLCSAEPVAEKCLRYCSRGTSTNGLESNIDPRPLPGRAREWLKTSSNCYIPVFQRQSLSGPKGVPPKGFEPLLPRPPLQSCGPVPFLDPSYRMPARSMLSVNTGQSSNGMIPGSVQCPSCPPLISTFQPIPTTVSTPTAANASSVSSQGFTLPPAPRYSPSVSQNTTLPSISTVPMAPSLPTVSAPNSTPKNTLPPNPRASQTPSSPLLPSITFSLPTAPRPNAGVSTAVSSTTATSISMTESSSLPFQLPPRPVITPKQPSNAGDPAMSLNPTSSVSISNSTSSTNSNGFPKLPPRPIPAQGNEKSSISTSTTTFALSPSTDSQSSSPPQDTIVGQPSQLPKLETSHLTNAPTSTASSSLIPNSRSFNLPPRPIPTQIPSKKAPDNIMNPSSSQSISATASQGGYFPFNLPPAPRPSPKSSSQSLSSASTTASTGLLPFSLPPAPIPSRRVP